MLFTKDLIEKILEGKKTMTSRSKRLYNVGDITNLRRHNKSNGK
jgi:hypothetical protein